MAINCMFLFHFFIALCDPNNNLKDNRFCATIIIFLSILLINTSVLCYSQTSQLIQVSSHVWYDLTEDERKTAISRYVIDVMSSDSIGVLIDVQWIDRSAPGTNSGQQIGAALGSAVYVDRAFSGKHDYSATLHIGASILGAIVGSSLDRPASTNYQFRYSVKTLSNQIIYIDEHTTEPFRKSMGACVFVPSLLSASQELCSEDVDSFRKRFSLKYTPAAQPFSNEQNNDGTVNINQQDMTKNLNNDMVPNHQSDIVRCKFGNNPPVFLDRRICKSASGEILQ